jgi:hypothetical protein
LEIFGFCECDDGAADTIIVRTSIIILVVVILVDLE